MHLQHTHPWNVSYAEAVAIQESLWPRVALSGRLGRVRRVAGVDVSYTRGDSRLYAALVLWDTLRGEVVDVVSSVRRAEFPYIPGLLTFREGPAVLDCFERLGARPDAVIYDGQGIAHPRRLGLAAHMGVLTGLPSIGCAKSRLVGTYRPPATEQGRFTPLRDGGQIVGSVLRTREGVKPMFVSVGHRLSLSQARRVVLRCARGYRLPEPTRIAHQQVNALRRAGLDGGGA